MSLLVWRSKPQIHLLFSTPACPATFASFKRLARGYLPHPRLALEPHDDVACSPSHHSAPVLLAEGDAQLRVRAADREPQSIQPMDSLVELCAASRGLPRAGHDGPEDVRLFFSAQGISNEES
jgi:hypothetical protein